MTPLRCRGPSLETARATAHACPGGITLVSDSTMQQLPMESIYRLLVICHLGDYVLREPGEQEEPEVVALYAAIEAHMVRGSTGRCTAHVPCCSPLPLL